MDFACIADKRLRNFLLLQNFRLTFCTSFFRNRIQQKLLTTYSIKRKFSGEKQAKCKVEEVFSQHVIGGLDFIFLV